MLAADIFGADRWAVLEKIDKPALVIASAESPVLNVQKEMADTIQGAKFVAIQDSAHAVFVDQPDEFNRSLETFLESLPD